MKTPPKIFLSYARPDEAQVREVYRRLTDAGFKPWMDVEDLLPGEIWESSITKAIRDSDFFIVFLSRNSVNRRGVLQKEGRQALDHWREKLDDDIYIIPARLEECEVPENMSGFQWVDIFRENGWEKLLRGLQEGVGRLSKPISSPKPLPQLAPGSKNTNQSAAHHPSRQLKLKSKLSRKNLLIAAIFFIVLAAGGYWAFFFNLNPPKSRETSPNLVELVTYWMESPEKNRFILHFIPHRSGYFYIIERNKNSAPIVWLSSQPSAQTGVRSNLVKSFSQFVFPQETSIANKSIGLTADTTFNVIFSKEQLSQPGFLASRYGHELTPSEQIELEALKKSLPLATVGTASDSPAKILKIAESDNDRSAFVFEIEIKTQSKI